MKYEVYTKLIEIYKIEVEADSELEAFEIAERLLEGDSKHQYHQDSDAESVAYEV